MTEEYAKYTYYMGAGDDSLTIRTDTLDELKNDIQPAKELLLAQMTVKKAEVKEILINNPPPYPTNITKPEACSKCGSTNLIYVTGTGKKGVWYAFDCLDCVTESDGKSYKTRQWVNPTDIAKKRPTVIPDAPKPSSDKKEASGIDKKVNCEDCGTPLIAGVVAYCNKARATKTPKYLCFSCQKEKGEHQ